jgi:hypothetical protein
MRLRLLVCVSAFVISLPAQPAIARLSPTEAVKTIANRFSGEIAHGYNGAITSFTKPLLGNLRVEKRTDPGTGQVWRRAVMTSTGEGVEREHAFEVRIGPGRKEDWTAVRAKRVYRQGESVAELSIDAHFDDKLAETTRELSLATPRGKIATRSAHKVERFLGGWVRRKTHTVVRTRDERVTGRSEVTKILIAGLPIARFRSRN